MISTQPQKNRPMPAALFPLGRTVATPSALELMDRHQVDAGTILLRHQTGDWGVVCQDDAKLNDQAVIEGQRILSAYRVGGNEKLWVITEWDRSVTTLLLPSEY